MTYEYGGNDPEFDLVTAKNLDTKDTPFATVTAFGAVGDGSTDDTQAIQDALNNAHTVWIPPVDNPAVGLSGDYYSVTGNINIPDYTTIYAPGWAGKIGFDSKPSGAGFTVGRRANIYGLFGYYATGGASAGSWPAVFSSTDEEAKFLWCKAKGDSRAAAEGFLLDVNGNELYGCDAEECQDGIRVAPGSSLNSIYGGITFDCYQGIQLSSGSGENTVWGHRATNCNRGLVFDSVRDTAFNFIATNPSSFGVFFDDANSRGNENTLGKAVVQNPDIGGVRFDGNNNYVDEIRIEDDRSTPQISWAVNDAGADNEIGYLRDVNNAGFANRGTRLVVENEARESTNAEQPQETGYNTLPVRVDFTDTGDGSGTGYYLIDRSETVHGPI